MTPAAAGLSGVRGGQCAPSLDLIHRSKCSNPASMRVGARLGGNSWSLEGGDSPAVVQAVFLLLVRLQEGAYDRAS